MKLDGNFMWISKISMEQNLRNFKLSTLSTICGTFFTFMLHSTTRWRQFKSDSHGNEAEFIVRALISMVIYVCPPVSGACHTHFASTLDPSGLFMLQETGEWRKISGDVVSYNKGLVCGWCRVGFFKGSKNILTSSAKDLVYSKYI